MKPGTPANPEGPDDYDDDFGGGGGGSGGGGGWGSGPPPIIPVTNDSEKELRLHRPEPYDGTKTKFRTFLQSVLLYLAANAHIFKHDKQKVAFALSYLTEGEAASWRQAWLESKTTPTEVDLGNWRDFVSDLNKAFTETDESGNALHTIRNMNQGSKTADEFVSEFKIVLSKTGLISKNHRNLTAKQASVDPGDIAARQFFIDALNRPLAKKILESDECPDHLEGWYEKAIKVDDTYRRAKAFWTRRPEPVKTNNNPRKQWTFTKKDPDAMDVDRLTMEQKEELRRKGQCFFCKEHGHIASRCPKKSNGSKQEVQRKKPWDTKTASTSISTLLSEYEKVDYEALGAHLANEAGF